MHCVFMHHTPLQICYELISITMCPRSPNQGHNLSKPRRQSSSASEVVKKPHCRYRPARVAHLHRYQRYTNLNAHERFHRHKSRANHPPTISAQSSNIKIVQCVNYSPYMLTLNIEEREDDAMKKLIYESMISFYNRCTKEFTVMFGKYVLVNNKGNNDAGKMANAIMRRIRGERA